MPFLHFGRCALSAILRQTIFNKNLMKTQNRTLGAFEKTFWLLDLIDSKDFALAADIEGKKSVAEWQRALEKVQQRHPNLCVRITMDKFARPVLRHVDHATIPLKILNVANNYDWEQEVEKELAFRFNTAEGPLLRAVVVQKPENTVLILIGHHAVADGTSISYLVRDLLLAITGTGLAAMEPQLSNDETLGFPEDEAGDETIVFGEAALLLNEVRTFEPKISSIRFNAGLTRDLIETSREHKTTVHAALCAAVLIASRNMRPEWAEKKIEMISPVCSRKALQLDDNYGLNITTHPVFFEDEQNLPFWEIARLAKAGLAGTDTVAHVQNYIGFFRELAFHTKDTGQIVEVLKNAFNQEIMVTNLGSVKYDTDFGSLRLKALYGPMVRSGKGNEQTIGAITSNGSLCLTNTSDKPIDGLLQAMQKILEDACRKTQTV